MGDLIWSYYLPILTLLNNVNKQIYSQAKLRAWTCMNYEALVPMILQVLKD
jgi:hypothetical protein